MNTPTKRIFYLFEPKFAKNEPQTKVWGSLTCKSQFLRLAESVSCAFAEAGCAPAAALQPDSAPACYLTPAFFLARSIAAICSSESLMEP